MKRILCLLFAAALVTAGGSLVAQQTQQGQAQRPATKGAAPKAAAPKQAVAAAAPAPSREDEEKAIRALVDAFTKAFNAGDAAAAAATFTEDALVILEDGSRTEGREKITSQLAAAFADSPGDSIAIEPLEYRFLAPDTVLEHGTTTITPPTGGTPERTKYSVVYVKKAGHWLQSVVRDETTGDVTPHDRLEELAWMVGEWVNESDEAVVHTTTKWSEDGNFLLREFTMKTRGQPVLSGTQRIGWDPTRQQFRTWVFDSEGGFGDGYWTRNGDQWLIKLDGVRQDGQHASSTSIITRLGKDRVGWQSVDRTLGSASLPGVDEFIIVRKPPEVGQ